LQKKSICLIEDEFANTATGFLVKLPLPSEENPMFGLLTNNHVLNSKSLRPTKSFDIYVNGNKFEISLKNDTQFKFTSELIDVTFIQLTDDNLMNNGNLMFLEWCDKDAKVKDIINIIQYIDDDDPYYSSGKIKCLCGFSYFHSGSTDEGSSGSPLINENLEIIGIHNSGISSGDSNVGKLNVATKLSSIYEAIRVFYHRNNEVYRIKKTRKSAKELSNEEKEELTDHGLQETPLPNVYECPYLNSSLVLLFYRTNHGWYWTSEERKIVIFDKKIIKIYDWQFINPYISVEENIDRFNGKLEYRHRVIMTWLQLSELMYM